MFGRLFLGASLVGTALAQISQISYTSPAGIQFNGDYDAAQDFTFGLAFPASTTGDEFIGEMVVPIKQKWAALSMATAMTGPPLIVGWPNGNKIVGSVRKAT
jgi:cellobiose dehydrogenase (acceptor)